MKTNFVLFQKGPLPLYINFCIKQIQKTQTNFNIYLLCDRDINVTGVTTINLKSIEEESLISLDYFIKDNNPLWRTSFERFFYIKNFLNKEKINNVVHFDNDVLIYHDVFNILNILQSEIFNVGITPHRNNEVVCGFVFIKNSNSLNEICEKLFLYAEYNITQLEQLLDSMPHEMRLLGEIKNTYSNLITELPVSPLFPGNNLFNKFNCVFDPSTYGQYIAGTHGSQGLDKKQIHLREPTRFIDRHIGNEFEPYFDSKTKKPVLNFNNNKINIFNLHIHSKQLEQYFL